jgi:hypothetical protein
MSTICPTLIQSYDNLIIYRNNYPEFHVLSWQYTGCYKVEATDRGGENTIAIVVTISNICEDLIINDVFLGIKMIQRMYRECCKKGYRIMILSFNLWCRFDVSWKLNVKYFKCIVERIVQLLQSHTFLKVLIANLILYYVILIAK